MKRHYVYAILALAVVVTIACGSSGQATEEPAATGTARLTKEPTETKAPVATATPKLPAASTIGKVGQRVESAGIALTVIKASKLDQFDNIWKPKEGNVYVVVDVTIENVCRTEAPYNPMYFRIKDMDGFEYSKSFAAPDPTLKSGNLAKGDKARGNVAFEVTKTATGLVLWYEPIVFFGGYQPIRIALE